MKGQSSKGGNQGLAKNVFRGVQGERGAEGMMYGGGRAWEGGENRWLVGSYSLKGG